MYSASYEQQERERARAVRQREQSGQGGIPHEWRPWLAKAAPGITVFADRHIRLWTWFDALTPTATPPARIEDWPRGGGKSSSVELGTTFAGSTGRRTFALYVSGTQAKADVHLQTISGVLERLGIARAVNKYNQSKGWTQTRLRAANGFNVVSFGLDAGSRGIKLDDYRPDLIILDDIDDRHDSLGTVQKKIETITQSILPSGSSATAILFVQNTIHKDGVMAQLIDGRAAFLLRRDPIAVEPAVRGLAYEQRRADDGSLHYVITGGEATWEGQSLVVCEAQINDWGLTAFQREAQHEVDDVTGSMFSHLDFAALRVDPEQLPELVRTVVWCDPAVSNTDTSDANGIIVDSLGVDGRIYRRYAWEQRASPETVLEHAYLKAVEYGAEAIGVETDQGGDTWLSVAAQAWQHLIAEQKIAPTTRRPLYRAAKAGSIGSKAERGGKMLAAYERDKLRHVRGTHTVLEKALSRFLIKKPFDLADTAFWGWKDLQSAPVPIVVPGGDTRRSPWQ